MTSIKLKRLLVGILQPLTGHGLKGGRRQRPDQLGNVGAAMDAAQPLPHAVGEARADGEADQFPVIRRNLIAITWIWRRAAGCFRVDDGQGRVDGDAQPHRVDGLTRGKQAIGQPEIDILAVVEMAFDIEQAIFALVATKGDVAAMQGLTGYSGGDSGMVWFRCCKATL